MNSSAPLLSRFSFSFLLLLLFTPYASADLTQVISLESGLIQGLLNNDSGNAVYRGIPYAAPPTGNNRWRAPQTTPHWSGIRSAHKFAPRCIQGGFGPGTDQTMASEDCLYLNVYTPAQSVTDKLPVMIWIHGGGFFTGSASDAIYDANSLASKGAIVVTINYRLGSFGFLAHSELSAEATYNSSGNYAMLDMVAAIEWVNKNIESFGGDSSNITLFGESAGAQAVADLMVSPLTKELFQRAILQSGGWMGLGLGQQARLSDKEVEGEALMSAFGANSLEELRQASAQEIFEHFPNAGSVLVDGYFMPEDASLLFSQNRQHQVDVLAGSNSDESYFFGPGTELADQFIEDSQQLYGELSESFLRLYPAGSDEEANASYHRSFSDALAWQMRQLARYQESRGNNAYVYYFTHVPPGQEEVGATHVAELAYVFNQQEQNQQWQAHDDTLAETLSSYWVNFARDGNPNGIGLPNWPLYTEHSNEKVQVLSSPKNLESNLRPSSDKLRFYQRAYTQQLRELERRRRQ